ncbi:Hypothetical predicted protein [Marmota monax]|uniref:Placenta-specific 8 protein n=1 Tax=Marmota monax TaxID=9995 RepID=A0A5E4BKC6_MARMO|nr:placenta-specific 8 protein [Marmota monax]VTJ69102.1 Hypothetical predicted protein [Marmota monax]
MQQKTAFQPPAANANIFLFRPSLEMQNQPTVIVTQPGFTRAPQNSNWQTGMCDCFSDCGVCLCGTFCFVCLGCQVAADMNECCLCGTTVAMRTLYRTRYGIPGSICDDYMRYQQEESHECFLKKLVVKSFYRSN